MRKQRKHCTAKGQVVILRRHFLEKVRVSDLCEELHLLYFEQRGPAWPLIRHKEQGQWQVACLASNGDLVSRERYVQRIH